MKEIGEYLKDARVNNGVSLDEASEDLNIAVIQLENIEEGNIRAFKDVFSLRDLVRDYAKYLGLETELVLDEFNDFMFEHTSRISLEDIMEAKAIKQNEEDKKDKIVSPYTKIKTPRNIKLKPIIICLGIIFSILLIILLIIKLSSREENITSELISSKERCIYECTY